MMPLAQLPEASGLTVGRGADAPLFAINDSGKPVLTVLDRSGKVTGEIALNGTKLEDWEDISAGSCGTGADGTCLFIADIGDNNRRRAHVTVLRLPQPAAGTSTAAAADAFEFAYPDGAHDAEATFVTADGQLFLVTKDRKSANLYRAPHPLRSGSAGRLSRVGEIALERVTDADTSPDGRWTALRNNHELLFFRTADLIAGTTKDPIRVDLAHLGEPQGEGVTLGADGAVYLVGEGGGNGRPGTFTTLTCTLPQ
jgi:hypothetical protein